MTAVVPPWVIQASSHPADVFRRQTRMLALGSQGIKAAGDLAVTANGTPNMSVNVAAGEAIINGTQNTVSQGAYEVLNDATVNLAIATSDPTNPRIDIVVAQVRDAAYSGANNDWVLAVVTGTPAPSPSPPATPANAIVLAQVAVAANATSIVSGNITDKRMRFGIPYRARASSSAGTSLTANVSAKIALATVTYDPNGNFDGVTNFRYTVPAAGYYEVIGKVGIPAAVAGAIYAFIFKNGAEVARAAVQANGGAMGLDVSDVISCVSGDYFELWGQSSQAQTTGGNVPDNSYMVVHFLSQ